VTTVTCKDLRWAEAIALGSPVAWGNVAAPMQRFLDNKIPVCFDSKVHGGKASAPLGWNAASAFASGVGGDTTIASLHRFLFAAGAVVVGPDPSDNQLTSSCTLGACKTDAASQLGRKLALVAAALAPTPSASEARSKDTTKGVKGTKKDAKGAKGSDPFAPISKGAKAAEKQARKAQLMNLLTEQFKPPSGSEHDEETKMWMGLVEGVVNSWDPDPNADPEEQKKQMMKAFTDQLMQKALGGVMSGLDGKGGAGEGSVDRKALAGMLKSISNVKSAIGASGSGTPAGSEEDEEL